MKIAVQLDHPSKLNAAFDTSFMLMEEAAKRGHAVYFYEAPHLSWRMGEVMVPLAPITVDTSATPAYRITGEVTSAALASVDVVLMRQDPPFDMAYITATHLLEQLPATTHVWNRPAGVRNCPEKLSILGFAQFIPPTLISRDAATIAEFAAQHKTVVAKPLYGFGGHSVFKFESGDANLATFLEHWCNTNREPLMWQAFLPEVTTDDRRVLLIDGKVASVFGREPAVNSIRANMRAGGTPVVAELTAKQQSICDALSPFLKSHGLLLAGIDFIGDYLTEINVTSPTGFRAAKRLYGVNLAATFWDKVEALR